MTDMIVSGAGTTAVNGTYIETGTYGGKPLYIYGSYSIGWDYNEMYGTGWHITSSLGYGYGYYWAGDNVSTPDLVTTWAGDWGEPPMPVVTAASSSQNLTLTCAAGSYSLTGTNVTLTATVKQNLTQAYDRIIATITTASDASQVVKAMVKSTEWREGTSGTWLSTDCTLKAGKVYQFRTPLSGMSSDTTAILPNIKASVTVAWDTTATPITSVGDYFMYSYAYGCSSLTSLSVPDTSGLTSVGAYFMRYYAINCSSLTSLMLPSATGWFESHNISWSVPSSRLNYLYGYAPNATSQTAWQALTVSGKTLYTNYIQSSSYVKVIEAKLPKFFLYYARMRGN